MKVLMINGSPNREGCTYTALSEVAKTLGKHGIESEIVHVGNKDIRGCIGCRKCKETGKCVFNDLVNQVAPKFAECDGIVIGSPVYFASANGTLVSFIDRLFYSTSVDKTMKVGAAVVSARRGGCSATFDELNKYFTISGMPVASNQYWNSVHGYTPEQVRQDAPPRPAPRQESPPGRCREAPRGSRRFQTPPPSPCPSTRRRSPR